MDYWALRPFVSAKVGWFRNQLIEDLGARWLKRQGLALSDERYLQAEFAESTDLTNWLERGILTEYGRMAWAKACNDTQWFNHHAKRVIRLIGRGRGR